MGRMGLALVVGPANAGKIARLLEGYLDGARARSGPHRAEPGGRRPRRARPAARARARCSAARSARSTTSSASSRSAAATPRPVASDAQRTLLVARASLARDAAERARPLGALRRLRGRAARGARASSSRACSSRSSSTATWRALRRLPRRARPARRSGTATCSGAARSSGSVGARRLGRAAGLRLRLRGPDGRGVGAARGARGPDGGDASRCRTSRAARRSRRSGARRRISPSLAGGRIEELPPAPREYGHAGARPPRAPPLRRRRRPPGRRSTARSASSRAPARAARSSSSAEEIRELRRARAPPPEEIALVVPSLERWRAPLETALGALGIPFAVEGRVRLGQTPFGQALLALLRFEWQQGGRRDLYALPPLARSPASRARTSTSSRAGCAAAAVSARDTRGGGDDQASRRAAAAAARGAAQRDRARRRRARGWPLRCCAARTASKRRRSGEASRARPPRLRRDRAPPRRARRLARARRRARRRDEVLAALEHAEVRIGSAAERGRVARPRPARARTRRFDAVFLLGLEEGTLPRRGNASPFLDDDARGELDRHSRVAARAPGPGRARPLPLLHRLHARDPAADARPRGGDRRGQPARAEPVLGRGRGALRARRRPRAGRAGGRSRSSRGSSRPRRPSASGCARWRCSRSTEPAERRGARGARTAGSAGSTARPARLHARDAAHAPARARASCPRKTPFNVTELERFADCSSAWFFERLISTAPRSTAEVDAMLRGSVAHTTLHRFYAGLPKALGSDRVEESRLDDALAFLRECLEGALGGVQDGDDRARAARARAEPAPRPRAARPRRGALASCRSCRGASRSASARSARRRSCSAASTSATGSRSPGRSTGSTSTRAAPRGIVQDYKSGRHGHSAAEIEKELRLQIPLYMLVLRDLVGIEPLGGLYRPLAGERRARGLLRAEAKDDVLPGLRRRTTTSTRRRSGPRSRAPATSRAASRSGSASGDVRHDPKGTDGCPAWCDLWRMCRIRRA